MSHSPPSIKNILKTCGVSVSELSRRTGISRTTIYKAQKKIPIRAETERQLLFAVLDNKNGHRALIEIDARLRQLGMEYSGNHVPSLSQIASILRRCHTAIKVHVRRKEEFEINRIEDLDKNTVVLPSPEILTTLVESSNLIHSELTRVTNFSREKNAQAFEKMQN